MLLDADIQQTADAIAAADLSTPEQAEAYRVRFLGRKAGAVTALFARMREVPADEKREAGQALNTLRQQAQARLDEALAAQAEATRASGTNLDLTLPGRRPAPAGSLHPLTQTLRDIEGVFRGLGFSVETGPEIEDDWHNFTALGFGPEHPARDMQDTFFLEPPGPDGLGGVVLRTHTSPVQIRALEAAVAEGPGGTLEAPLRIIAPGRVYRNEAISYKSFCLFHQVEGLVVDERVTFADLKDVLYTFAEAFFGEGVTMRFRPSFFPFTEPSAEVDIWWADEGHPEGGRWLEILGCGLVDPVVLENVGLDPERYSGYAFGMGVERMAMLRHGIPDIRLLYENDVRFLEQF